LHFNQFFFGHRAGSPVIRSMKTPSSLQGLPGHVRWRVTPRQGGFLSVSGRTSLDVIKTVWTMWA
jgi:hypothetical protein